MMAQAKRSFTLDKGLKYSNLASCGDRDPKRAWDQDLLPLGSHVVTPSRCCFGQLEIANHCLSGIRKKIIRVASN